MAVALSLSVAVNITVFAPTVAEQVTVTVALIVPLLLVGFVIVMPADTEDAVTVTLPAGVWSSLTVASVTPVATLPCFNSKARAGVIVGGVFCVVGAHLPALSAL